MSRPGAGATEDKQALTPETFRNPFPHRPKCVREWDEAEEYCWRLARHDRLGKHPYEGHGDDYEQCVRGQVSADCGGNPIV